ncbi:penicillin-insensitive murein endopeptidase [Pseudoroseomonas deserti]|uniref:Penicillin-insensitive murein endopeptidase n=1 Tax=Teichococcus deserti TaxID=1817963 RepID=A0A1V2GU43_9PROT|nr:penicillin-insensitive murein endopeptidase [Pseudoroseomonas deserti]ONG42414.1 penicillin-insensitive murein endopeptidase [Pseudoroseomonas deserti]
MARLRQGAGCALLAGLALAVAGGAALAADPPRASAWAAARGPAPGAPHVVGAHGLGCIGGAEAMPESGPGFQMVRLSRNRFWGHPALTAYLRDLGARSQAAGLPALWYGDLGQPRGGPLPWGHASHQIGLDADIWFDLRPKPALTTAQREQIAVASLVRPDGMDIDPAQFTPRHVTLLRLAAEHPGVDRIFVNPAIKQAICRQQPEAAWLRKLRPWRGHDEHFHVRLRCPPGQGDCHDQAPVPAGTGCDASLDWWFSAEARQPPKPRPPGPAPRMPAACAGILAAP